MQSIRQTVQVNNDGVVQIQLPKELVNSKVDILLVYQPISTHRVNQKLLSLYGACADDPIASDDEGVSDAMDDDLIGVFDRV